MRFYLFPILLSSTCAFAVDYSLCTEFFKSQSPDLYLMMGSDGRITPKDQGSLAFYKESDSGDRVVLARVWSNKTNSNKEETVTVEMIKSETNVYTFKRRASSKEGELEAFYPGYVAGVIGAIEGVEIPVYSASEVLKLSVRNGKCYPVEIEYSGELGLEGKLGSRKTYSSVVSSGKCRKIVEFYRANSSFLSCTSKINNKNLKELKTILGNKNFLKGFSNDMVNDILRTRVSVTDRLVQHSLGELDKCNTVGFTSSVLDNELWKNETSSSGLKTFNSSAARQ